MNELYWLTTLSNVCSAITILFGLSAIALVILGLAYFAGDVYDVYSDDDKRKFSMWKKWFKASCITIITTFVLLIFVPSERQIYLIYGVGGTIDYIKNNDAAKQLPDKTIQCLDKFMDEYLNNKNDN